MLSFLHILVQLNGDDGAVEGIAFRYAVILIYRGIPVINSINVIGRELNESRKIIIYCCNELGGGDICCLWLICDHHMKAIDFFGGINNFHTLVVVVVLTRTIQVLHSVNTGCFCENQLFFNFNPI